jgi:conjugative transposon TraM protein
MKQIEQNTPRKLRRRKMFLVMPVLVMPFLSVLFWTLEGGSGKQGKLQEAESAKGFNMNLPPAHFTKKENTLDKLGFYKKADEDSVKLMEKIKQDPYHLKAVALIAPRSVDSSGAHGFLRSARDGDLGTAEGLAPSGDQQATQLLQRLEQLKRTIRQPETSSMYGSRSVSVPEPVHGSLSPETTRLKSLVETLRRQDVPDAPDSQMDRLNGMLDKILRIQHPVKNETVGNTAANLPKPAEFRAASVAESLSISVPDTNQVEPFDSSQQESPGFYIIGGDNVIDSVVGNTIPAVVEGDQTIISGSTVTLRLSEDCYLNGKLFPRENLLYGMAAIKNDRIQVIINSIQCENSIYPVALQVYDVDGLAGIHISNWMTRDVVKQSAGDAVNTTELGSFDPSLGAQAANAGIQAAKSLLGKRIKLPKVSVEAGYPVLLKSSDTSHK